MKIVIWLIFFSTLALYAREDVSVATGNFSLPTSQQPAPLFCFGQTVIDKGDILLYGYIDYLKGTRGSFTEVVPQLYYGITDNLSLGIGVPIAAKFKLNGRSSSGFEDLIVQLEYAFYNNDHPTHGTQLTFVTDVTFPTGSTKKTPVTGLGSPSFFLGLTASYMSTKWYLFASPGYIITTPHNNTHLGNQWLYQWGLGRNIYYVPSKRILTVLLEFFGTQGGLDTLPLKASQRLGGNNLFIGPSLWFATERLVLNAGIAFPAMQKISATNTKHKFLFACEAGWKFN
jgi:hypothetical protein